MAKKKKGGWWYGVIRKTGRRGNKTIHWYEIREIYPWGKKGALMWTEEAIAPTGATVNELRETLTMMLLDSFKMPVYKECGNKLIKRCSNG